MSESTPTTVDGGETVERDQQNGPETVDPADPPANERVLLVTGIAGKLHTPTIVEGETSGSGATIAVEDTLDRKRRLDASEIFAGEYEYRGSTYYALYAVERLQKHDRANRQPGPRAGTDDVRDGDGLPDPTHALPSEGDA